MVIAPTGEVVDGFDDDDERTIDGGIEEVLRAAFAARASGVVSDLQVVAMSEPIGPAAPRPGLSPRNRLLVLWVAPLTAIAVVASVVAVIIVLSHKAASSNSGTLAGSAGPTSTAKTPRHSAGSSPTSTRPTAPPPKIVKVTSDLTDGEKVGVGEPIVLNFSPSPTDSSAFTKAVTVTVDDKPATGAWYWEWPYAGEPIQAHYRERTYWPADSTIRVKLPIGGLSAGTGLAYAGGLTSVTFETGDAHISTVNGANLQMTVTSNNRLINTVPVSLGAAATPTFTGIKVVMQKGEDAPGTDALPPSGTVMMSGPGYSNDPVPWSVRVTASGEYVHAAAWNTHIGVRSTSNGCTNLRPGDGHWFYKFSLLGDVVQYVNISDGTRMNPLDGLGDWNILWGEWTQGGQLSNH